ncbi:UDP binding domain-containing protein, partial [Vibrio parahaemolyticus]
CYGLAFKPDIDDLRESPALKITKSIAENHRGKVLAIEPNVEVIDVENVELVSLDESLTRTDVHVMLVDHKQFKKIKLNAPFVVDTKGIW